MTTNIAIDTEANFSPDGKSIAFTSNRTGQIQAYIKNLKSGTTFRVPIEGNYNANPVYSPDGKSMAFTSNRTVQVQIYIKNLETGKIKRATFKGAYNAKPVFSPDGKELALIHRVGKDYRLALLNIATRYLTIMTQNKSDESPYFSPNGGMIIFATNRDNKGILSIISLHNNQIVELTQKDGVVREPSWSNYSN